MPRFDRAKSATLLKLFPAQSLVGASFDLRDAHSVDVMRWFYRTKHVGDVLALMRFAHNMTLSRLGSCLFVFLLTGCSGGTEALNVASLVATSNGPAVVKAGPVEAYRLIARGVLTCWLAPKRPLSGRYRFFGDAKTSSSGGTAKIVIHERANTGKKGLRAFAIDFEPSGGTTSVVSNNVRLSNEQSEQLKSDIVRWSSGATSCAARPEEWVPVNSPSSRKRGKRA